MILEGIDCPPGLFWGTRTFCFVVHCCCSAFEQRPCQVLLHVDFFSFAESESILLAKHVDTYKDTDASSQQFSIYLNTAQRTHLQDDIYKQRSKVKQIQANKHIAINYCYYGLDVQGCGKCGTYTILVAN